jgi:hypothetical protein
MNAACPTQELDQLRRIKSVFQLTGCFVILSLIEIIAGCYTFHFNRYLWRFS